MLWLQPKFIYIYFLLLILTACGFHLREGVEIPQIYQPLLIQANGTSLGAAIAERLTGSPVRLTNERTKAGLILRILSEKRAAHIAAVDINSKVLAYELHFIVSFDALAKDGKQLIQPETLDLLRTFDNPDVEVLGKRLEEELIYKDFATDAADRILMRLRAVLLNSLNYKSSN